VSTRGDHGRGRERVSHVFLAFPFNVVIREREIDREKERERERGRALNTV